MARFIAQFLAAALLVTCLFAGCPDVSPTDLGHSTPAAETTPNRSGNASTGGQQQTAETEAGPPRPGDTTGEPSGTTESPAAGSQTVSVSSLTATTGIPATSGDDPSTCTIPMEAPSWQGEVLRLVNTERLSRNLTVLTWNARLEQQAAAYACEMITGEFFAHENPFTGSTLADRAADFAYAYWAIGENLAAGQRTPAEVVTAWMDSHDHRENILQPAFTELGVAVRTGGPYGIYWVQEFGRPQSAGAYDAP